VALLVERGLNPAEEYSKALTEEPGKRYVDWELDDPAGRPVEEVRPIVEEIDHRVLALLDELVGSPPS
jgi:protein-tyrosine-phosphatase